MKNESKPTENERKKRNRKNKKKREERSICTTNPLVAVISYTRPHVVELCRPYYHHRFAPINRTIEVNK